MEQTTQQTIQKPSLPIKTKIAAWWMIIIGIILGSLGLCFIILPSHTEIAPIVFFTELGVAVGSLLFFYLEFFF